MENLLKNYKVFNLDLYKLRSKNFHNDMIKDRKMIYKKFFDCLNKEKDFSCNLCFNSNKIKFLSWEEYHLYQCLECGAVSPNFNLKKWSKKNYYFQSLVNEDVKREIILTYKYRKDNFGKERLSYLKNLIKNFNKIDHKFLDIGCGPGYFLDYLREIESGI